MQPYANVEVAARTIACIEQFDRLRTREDAAHAAAHALMHAVITHAHGRQTTIFEMAEAYEVADAVEHAACDMFIALTHAGMTYHEFSQLSGTQVLTTSRQVRAAVRHFYTVISNVRDLYRMVIEQGENMLAPFD
jgi:predicted peroxiredoxin